MVFFAGCSSAVCGSLFLPVLAVFSGCFERFFASSISRYDFLFEKSLTRLPGIDIFAGMSNLFFGFYSLAACVAAAVSQSKKAVSAAAAVVVGIGLLTAPMEKAQAQTKDVLTYSAVGDVYVYCLNDVIYFVSVNFHVFDTSSKYEVWSASNLGWQGQSRYDELDRFNASAYYSAQYRSLSLPFGELISIRFSNRHDSSDWIDVDLYISAFPSEGTGEGRYAACYVTHSTTYGGTEAHGYYVDVYCPSLVLDVRKE